MRCFGVAGVSGSGRTPGAVLSGSVGRGLMKKRAMSATYLDYVPFPSDVFFNRFPLRQKASEDSVITLKESLNQHDA